MASDFQAPCFSSGEDCAAAAEGKKKSTASVHVQRRAQKAVVGGTIPIAERITPNKKGPGVVKGGDRKVDLETMPPKLSRSLTHQKQKEGPENPTTRSGRGQEGGEIRSEKTSNPLKDQN